MQNRRALIVVLLTIFIDAMGIGLIMPVMPDLIEKLEGGTIGEAALWGGILLTTFSVMQFLFGPLLGALSDRYGRRPILLISLAVMAADYLIMAIADTIWLLVLTRVVGGITAATMATAYATIADISPEEKKSANFGLIGAAFGLGFVMGPAMGGFLTQISLSAPFYAAAIISGGTAIYGYFAFPETLEDENRRSVNWRRANPFGAFKTLARVPDFLRLVFLFFAYEFAFLVYPSIWPYFGKERFGWDPAMVGLSLMLFGISMAVVQGALMRVALGRMSERRLINFGFSFGLLSFVILTFLESGLWAMILIPLSALAAVVTPALQGRMSRQADADQQGELQGLLTSVRAVAAIFSPLLMTRVFAAYTDDSGPYFPGAPFALCAGILLVCLILFALRKRMA